MILVADSRIWIEFIRGIGSEGELLLATALGNHSVLLPDLVRFEVLRGWPSEKKAAALALDFDSQLHVTAGGNAMASKAAENYRKLRRVGITVRNSIDMLIGTWCIENNVPLLHNDRDYDGMEKHLGLLVWRGERA